MTDDCDCRFGAVLEEQDIAEALQEVLDTGDGPVAILPAVASANA